MVGVSAAMHFLVDGLCVCCLYLMVDALGFQDMPKVFLTYNVLAFMTQPLTGWLADCTKHRHWLLLAAVVLLATAVMAAAVTAAVSGIFPIPVPGKIIGTDFETSLINRPLP